MSEDRLRTLLEKQLVAEVHQAAIGYLYAVSRVLVDTTSEYQRIQIVKNPVMGRMLLLDSLMMLSEKDEFIYHECLVHIPLLHHPRPRRVMVIGGGDGGTVREVLKHSSVETVTLVEIDQQVIDLCKEHLPVTAGQLDDHRVQIHCVDAIQYVADLVDAGGEPYDVILSDSTDPVGFAEGLFSVEFYMNCKSILGPEGIFPAQTSSPLFQQSECRMAWDHLRQVFEEVRPYWAPVPVYPGAIWSFMMASVQGDSRSRFQRSRCATVLSDTRYLSPNLAISAFVLPAFMQNLLDLGDSIP